MSPAVHRGAANIHGDAGAADLEKSIAKIDKGKGKGKADQGDRVATSGWSSSGRWGLPYAIVFHYLARCDRDKTAIGTKLRSGARYGDTKFVFWHDRYMWMDRLKGQNGNKMGTNA